MKFHSTTRIVTNSSTTIVSTPDRDRIDKLAKFVYNDAVEVIFIKDQFRVDESVEEAIGAAIQTELTKNYPELAALNQDDEKNLVVWGDFQLRSQFLNKLTTAAQFRQLAKFIDECAEEWQYEGWEYPSGESVTIVVIDKDGKCNLEFGDMIHGLFDHDAYYNG